MPTVGMGHDAMHFDYSPAGIAKAKKVAKKMGKTMKMAGAKAKKAASRTGKAK